MYNITIKHNEIIEWGFWWKSYNGPSNNEYLFKIITKCKLCKGVKVYSKYIIMNFWSNSSARNISLVWQKMGYDILSGANIINIW